jgi:hypothetical protein
VKEQKKEEEQVWGFDDCINSSRPFHIVSVTLLYQSETEGRKAFHLASGSVHDSVKFLCMMQK